MKFFVRYLFVLSFLPASLWAEDPIRLGAILHLTGDLAAPSAAFREGIELAVDGLNQRPDAPHYSVTYEDGHNASKDSFAAGQRLLAEKKLSAVILESYLDMMSSGALFEKAKIPSICIWDSNPEIDNAGKYFFAIGPWTPSAGEEAARYAVEELKGKTAYIFLNPDSWSEGVVKFFQSEFEKRGGTVLGTSRLNPGDTDFRTLIAKTAARNPDFIYTPLVLNLIPFYSQLKALHFAKPVVTSDIIADEHISKAPEAFEGIYQTGIRDPDSKEYQDVAQRYEAKFGKKVTLPWFVAVGYDAVNLIDKAVREVGPTPEQISKGLYSIRDYRGASSTISINEKGTSPQIEVMFRITNKKLVPVSK